MWVCDSLSFVSKSCPLEIHSVAFPPLLQGGIATTLASFSFRALSHPQNPHFEILGTRKQADIKTLHSPTRQHYNNSIHTMQSAIN